MRQREGHTDVNRSVKMSREREREFEEAEERRGYDLVSRSVRGTSVIVTH